MLDAQRASLSRRLGIAIPIFAFSHCRDVVVEVTRAGGFGVLGAVTFSPEQLERELAWIDSHVGGRPYGIDVLMATSYERAAETASGPLIDMVPEAQREFVTRLLDEEGVPRLPPGLEREIVTERAERDKNNTRYGARRLIDVALNHPQVRMVVSALGVPPAELVGLLRARGILVGGLCGKPEHVRHHQAAGVDVIIAQGSEAAGHTGSISSMVLWPHVVDACAGTGVAVLAAGGFSTGRHVAAAEALGADGAWIGSLWLGTRESELLQHEKAGLFTASSSDTVQATCMSGKTARMLKSKWTDAWARPDAPPTLPTPLQGVLFRWANDRIARVGRTDLVSVPVGQAVGVIRAEESTREVMVRLQSEYLEVLGRMDERLRDLSVETGSA